MKLKITLVSVILLIIVLFLSSCTQPVKPAIEKTPNTEPVIKTSTSENIPADTKTSTETKENTVEITSSGFNPKTLTVNTGSVVTFLNKDAAQHWPASAFHPTHNVYPEPGGCIGSKFDSCRGLNKDEIFAFKFNQKGTWKYHDHLNPSLYGTIIVK